MKSIGRGEGKIDVLIDFIIIVSYCSRYVRNMFEVKPESGEATSDGLTWRKPFLQSIITAQHFRWSYSRRSSCMAYSTPINHNRV